MNLKNKIVEYINNKNFNYNQDTIINIAIYFILSFIIGFFIRKFFVNVLLLIIWSIILLSFLYYKDIIRFNSNIIQQYLSFVDNLSISEIMSNILNWCQNNTIETIAILIGLYLSNLI